MNKTRWIIFIVVTIGALASLVIFSDNSKINVEKTEVNIVQTASKQNGNIADHIFGKVGSKVTLIEYGDYQCPGCGSINPSIVAVAEQYKDQLQFIFRNFPLTDAHPNAKAAAAAAEAAGLQNKFWEMHNKIYANQSDWENLSGTERTNIFVKYATDFDLDSSKFKNDMSSVAVNNKINYDKAIGIKAEVDSTPSYYLNGVKLESSVWGESAKLKEAINAELNKAGIALPQSNE